MTLLYASERPPYPFRLGGAARSAHALMAHLRRVHGVACEALGSSRLAAVGTALSPEQYDDLQVRSLREDNGSWEVDCGYPIRLVPDFYRALEERLTRARPDLLWAQLNGAARIAEMGRARDIETLLFVHDAEFVAADVRRAADAGARVACCSTFVANRLRETAGVRATVIYVPVAADAYRVTPDADGLVTLINPVRVKGVETFFEVATRLHQERFLAVECWPLADERRELLDELLARTPNVTFMRRVADVRAVYRRTRLLLVPSVWEEAHGRVVREAQISGIPVLASRRGGLPETVGAGGELIDDYLDAEAWVRAIRSVAEPARYRRLGELAKRNAARPEFDVTVNANRLLEWLP